MESDMTLFFWLITIVMAVAAYAFIAAPLLKKGSSGVIAVVAIALPVLSTGLYFFLGSPSTLHEGSSQIPSVSTAPQATDGQAGSVASMTEGLAERLQNEPDDGKGWLLLAKSYNHLNRSLDANTAYKKAAALGQIDTEFEALLNAASSSADSPVQIYGNVSLSDAAKEIVLPDDTVFIFARAVDGPTMPVAVLQRSASDLPIDFMLNDSQSMTENLKLSMFDRVVVSARISRSGIATDALQGLEAKTGELNVSDNEHLNLIIGNKK
jgi:hypothetical protein